MAPQFIVVAFWIFGLGIAIADHGQLKRRRQNFFTTLFAVALNALILYWGGFFDQLIDRLSR